LCFKKEEDLQNRPGSLFSSLFLLYTMNDEEYDYESLGSNTTITQNAFAGALAGIAEHCAMYPVDSIKVKPNNNVKTTSIQKKISLSFRLECRL
jgi:hypothetical protein